MKRILMLFFLLVLLVFVVSVELWLGGNLLHYLDGVLLQGTSLIALFTFIVVFAMIVAIIIITLIGFFHWITEYL